MLTPSPTSSPWQGVSDTVGAIEQEDINLLMSRVQFLPVECRSDAWPQPECDAGQREGSLEPRFPFVSCEPIYLRQDEVRLILTQLVTGRAPGLVAARDVEGTADPESAFPVAPIALLFRTTAPAGPQSESALLAVMDRSGQLVSLRTGVSGHSGRTVPHAAGGSALAVANRQPLKDTRSQDKAKEC
jgi:hypothetical protein